MSTAADGFEARYRRWREATAASLRSDDAAYVDTPEFAAIVALGPPAIPAILERMEADPAAHHLVHALERITGHRFSAGELDAAREGAGGPLGNQQLAALWRAWWHDRTAGREEGR